MSAVLSRRPASAAALAALVPGCAPIASSAALVAACDLVFLTVPDDAIADAAASLPWRPGLTAVHTSGAAELVALDAAKKRGAAVGAFHPLTMFSDPQTAARALAGSAVAVEGDGATAALLQALALGIGARPITVPAGARAAYHAAAHYAAGFICVLLHEAEQIWRRAGIDMKQNSEGDAVVDPVRALLPLVRGALDAVERSGPAAAMQGAVARGDLGTVAKHLDALDAIGMQALYRPLALRAVDIALETGRIGDARADELRRLLAQSPP